MNNNSIVTARLTEVIKHPAAKKLKICQVNDGQNSYQVVCGAENAQQGMVSILAKIGAKTPSGLEIKAAELRGVESHGMLCSAKDLKLSEESGIVDLPKETKLGEDWRKLDPDIVSSIPWYQYKECEAFYWNEKEKRIHVKRGDAINSVSAQDKLISKTYFHKGEYLHRHFK